MAKKATGKERIRPMPQQKKVRPESVPHPLGTAVYSTDQVAQALNLSVRHILRAIQKGELEARKTGKQYLITQDAVRKYWEGLPLATPPRGRRQKEIWPD
jgi:excisionase family DNA binding protein